MPSKYSHVAPSSYWHLAQISIEEAEKQALTGAISVLTLPQIALYETLTIEADAPRFIYTAHYRQTEDGWPSKGRTEKRISRHDAIDVVAENAEVAENRERVASEVRREHVPVSAELQRLFDRVVEDPALHAPRHL